MRGGGTYDADEVVRYGGAWANAPPVAIDNWIILHFLMDLAKTQRWFDTYPYMHTGFKRDPDEKSAFNRDEFRMLTIMMGCIK